MESIRKVAFHHSEQFAARKFKVAGAQLGPIHQESLRSEVLSRMLHLMDKAYKENVKLLVYPELAFTTFFPRHLITNEQELEMYFERDVNGDPTQAPGMKAIFDRARNYGMDISLGYAECDTAIPENREHVHYNTAVYFSAAAGKVIAKYRKIHLPGTVEAYEQKDATNQLEKRYFKPGNLGFEAFRAPGLVISPLTQADRIQSDGHNSIGKGDAIIGIMICNDRRWPEAWRCYGLQGVELVLCGYNTTCWSPELLGTSPKITSKDDAKREVLFHNRLCVQHGSYTNACWSINVAKCGLEDGKYPLIGGSCIVDPDGEIVVEACTEDDELIIYDIDLGQCRRGKEKTFAFEKHRRPEHYARIINQIGVVEPDLL